MLLKAHALKVVGPTTVDGRRAIELAGPKAGTKVKYNPHDLYTGAGLGLKIWVNAKTYAPIKEISEQISIIHSTKRAFYSTATWLEYKTVPITPANERLLTPLSVHPHAHIDRNYNDYVNATSGEFEPQDGLSGGFP